MPILTPSQKNICIYIKLILRQTQNKHLQTVTLLNVKILCTRLRIFLAVPIFLALLFFIY